MCVQSRQRDTIVREKERNMQFIHETHTREQDVRMQCQPRMHCKVFHLRIQIIIIITRRNELEI